MRNRSFRSIDLHITSSVVAPRAIFTASSSNPGASVSSNVPRSQVMCLGLADASIGT